MPPDRFPIELEFETPEAAIAWAEEVAARMSTRGLPKKLTVMVTNEEGEVVARAKVARHRN